jgi:hypothetical protein
MDSTQSNKKRKARADPAPTWSLLTEADWAQLTDVYENQVEPLVPPAGVLKHQARGKNWIKESGSRDVKLARFAQLRARALADPRPAVDLCLLVFLTAVDDGAAACLFPFMMTVSPLVCEELRALCVLGTVCYRSDGTLRCNRDQPAVLPADMETDDDKSGDDEEDDGDDDDEPVRTRRLDEQKQAAISLVRALCRTHLDSRRDWSACSSGSSVPPGCQVSPLVYVYGL